MLKSNVFLSANSSHNNLIFGQMGIHLKNKSSGLVAADIVLPRL